MTQEQDWGLAPLPRETGLALTRVAEGILVDPAGRILPMAAVGCIAGPFFLVVAPLVFLAWVWARLMVGRFLLLNQGGWRWLRRGETRNYPPGIAWEARPSAGGLTIRDSRGEVRVFGVGGGADFAWLADTLTRLKDRPQDSAYLSGPPGWEIVSNPWKSGKPPSTVGQVLSLGISLALMGTSFYWLVSSGRIMGEVPAGLGLAMALLALLGISGLAGVQTEDPELRRARLVEAMLRLTMAVATGMFLMSADTALDQHVAESTATVRESFQIDWTHPSSRERHRALFVVLQNAPGPVGSLLCLDGPGSLSFEFFTPGAAWGFKSGPGLLGAPWYEPPEVFRHFHSEPSLPAVRLSKNTPLAQMPINEVSGNFAPDSDNLRFLKSLGVPLRTPDH